AFVRDRLPAGTGPEWAAPYLAWAHLAALVPRGVEPTAPLTAALFHRILERAGLADDDAGATDDTLANLATRPPPGWNAVARALLLAPRPALALRAAPRVPPPATGVHGRVFEDRNADGTQDGGEPGVANATVLLVDDGGAIRAEATTGVAGDYTLALVDGART